MKLLIVALVYCFITHFLGVTYASAIGFFLLVASFAKGFFSHKRSNILNLEKTSVLFKKIGLPDTLTELLVFIILVSNSLLINGFDFNGSEIVFQLFLFILLFRFSFWGISRTIKERNNSSELGTKLF